MNRQTGKLLDPRVRKRFSRRRCLDVSSSGSSGSVCRCSCCHTAPLCVPPAALAGASDAPDVLASSQRAKFSHMLYCRFRKTARALPSFKLLQQLPTPPPSTPTSPSYCYSSEREGPHPKFGSREPVVVCVLHGNH